MKRPLQFVSGSTKGTSQNREREGRWGPPKDQSMS